MSKAAWTAAAEAGSDMSHADAMDAVLASVADDRTLEEIAARATDASVPEESRIYYIYALRGRSTPTIASCGTAGRSG